MKEHTIIRWKSRGSVTFIFPLLKNPKYKSNIETDAMFTSFKEILYEDSFPLFVSLFLSVSISTTLSLFSTNLTSYAGSICSCSRFRVSILNIHKFV